MKRIAILGAGNMFGVIANSLSIEGFNPIHEKQINKRGVHGFMNQDLTNTAKQPIKSSYNAKQRKAKANRKGASK